MGSVSVRHTALFWKNRGRFAVLFVVKSERFARLPNGALKRERMQIQLYVTQPLCICFYQE